MKQEHQTERIVVQVNTAQKNAIGDAANRAGMTTSEYIRSRTISHRASFAIPGEVNEFYTETQQGFVGDTRTGNVAHDLGDVNAKFGIHILAGYHADCVICQQKDAEIAADKSRLAEVLNNWQLVSIGTLPHPADAEIVPVMTYQRSAPVITAEMVSDDNSYFPALDVALDVANEERENDPRTPAERDQDEASNDYADTVNSVRPGGM